MKKMLVVLAGLVALPLAAADGAAEWSCREAKVDARGGYVVLLHGSGDADPESWVPVARVGAAQNEVFPVQWLVDPKAVENKDRVEAAVDDLDYYLKDIGRPDPWSYAQYHCGTASNWYSRVHWLCGLGQRSALRAVAQRAIP
jgi:hypothetical protein